MCECVSVLSSWSIRVTLPNETKPTTTDTLSSRPRKASTASRACRWWHVSGPCLPGCWCASGKLPRVMNLSMGRRRREVPSSQEIVSICLSVCRFALSLTRAKCKQVSLSLALSSALWLGLIVGTRGGKVARARGRPARAWPSARTDFHLRPASPFGVSKNSRTEPNRTERTRSGGGRSAITVFFALAVHYLHRFSGESCQR